MRWKIRRSTSTGMTVQLRRNTQAKMDLSYSRVTAPIDGRIDRILVTEGNLVSSSQGGAATLLTTIVSSDPLYVYFDIDDFPTAPLHTCHQLVVHITADPYQFIAAVHLLCFVYSLILLHNYRFNTTLDHCQYQYSKIRVTLNFDHLHLVDHLCNHQFVVSVSIGTFDFEFFCLCYI